MSGGGPEYVIMLTQRCNFRCTYCYQTHASIDLDRATLERVVAAVRADTRADPTVVFHGGEPLLRRDLLEHGVSLLLDADGSPVCRFAVVTNGSLADGETVALFARHHFRVTVSFDGCREAQAFRDAASFDRVVANLRELVAEDESGRIELRVAVTVTLDNLPYLGRSVAFLTDLGVRCIQIEGDLYGGWVEGTESEVERQVEDVVRQMEQRAADGLPVPVSRLQPLADVDPGVGDGDGASRELRLSKGECSCGVSGSALVGADGSVWACPMFAPGLGRVDPGRLSNPEAFRYGSWNAPDAPSPERVRSNGQEIREEPLMGTKGERYSIFSDCASCPYVVDCNVCPAASHLPDAEKPAEEVPPLLCALNMAFLSRRHRIRRPATFLDVVLSVARGG